MGTKEERFLRGAAKLGLPHQTSKDITVAAYRPQENAILQPQGTAGRTSDREAARVSAARGCTFCGHCPQGCIEPLEVAAQPAREAVDARELRADGAHGRSVDARQGVDADRRRVRGAGRDRWFECHRCHVAEHADRRVDDRGGEGRRARRRAGRDAAAVAEQRLAESRTIRSAAASPITTSTTSSAGSRRTPARARARRPLRGSTFPAIGGLEQAGVSPGLQGQALTSSDSGIAGFYDNGAPVGAWGADAVGRLSASG